MSQPWYPDRRAQYDGLSPADFEAGKANPNNPQKFQPKSDIAKRGDAPSKNFRVTTDPDNPANQPPPEAPPEPPKPAFDAVPAPESIDI